MLPQNTSRIAWFFFALLSLMLGLALTYSPGTTDMGIWQNWTNSGVAHGLVAGYAANQADYPPLAHATLLAANWICQSLHLPTFLSIKASILAFLLLTCVLFWLWTRDLKVSLLLYYALLLNSMGLSYIDIYFAPGLVLSLWMLRQKRWTWFSLAFTLTCLTKWQPLIIAPFFLLYCLGIEDLSALRAVNWTRLLPRLLAPAALLIGGIVALFGFQPVWMAFRASLSHEYLSGNALNINWVITHILHLTDPNTFGGLQEGLSGYILTDSLRITFAPRLLFALTYLLTLFFFFRREKTFNNLLVFCCLGFLCYYTFNVGVHENHLFLVAILAVVLGWLRTEWRVYALIMMAMNNVNLFLFYGVDGELHFPRLFAGIDMALPLAVLNLAFFFFFAWSALRWRDQPVSEPSVVVQEF